LQQRCRCQPECRRTGEGLDEPWRIEMPEIFRRGRSAALRVTFVAKKPLLAKKPARAMVYGDE
jgi:hypothetical protein